MARRKFARARFDGTESEVHTPKGKPYFAEIKARVALEALRGACALGRFFVWSRTFLYARALNRLLLARRIIVRSLG